MEDTREELRSAISKLGAMGRGKRYPRPLLEKMSYTVARRRQGATLLAVGAEIGMNWKTLLPAVMIRVIPAPRNGYEARFSSLGAG